MLLPYTTTITLRKQSDATAYTSSSDISIPYHHSRFAMLSFESLPLELRFLIIELALPPLPQTPPASVERKRSNIAYSKAAIRLATTSRFLLTNVCCFVESLQRQHNEPKWDNVHPWCVQNKTWICAQRKGCLLDTIMQAMLRVRSVSRS